jgi:hypothetical protein
MSPSCCLSKVRKLSRHYGYFQVRLRVSGPESSKFIEQQFAGLPADIVNKIIGENVANFCCQLLWSDQFSSERRPGPLSEVELRW